MGDGNKTSILSEGSAGKGQNYLFNIILFIGKSHMLSFRNLYWHIIYGQSIFPCFVILNHFFRLKDFLNSQYDYFEILYISVRGKYRFCRYCRNNNIGHSSLLNIFL